MMYQKQVLWMVCLMAICGVVLTGCKKEEPVVEKTISDVDRMQGAWKGTELGGRGGEWALVIADDKLTVDGPGPEDYAGTLVLDETAVPKTAVLTITECAVTEYVGAKGNNLYKVEGDMLTIAGAEPGTDSKPTSFEPGNGTRVFEFKKVVPR